MKSIVGQYYLKWIG